MYPHSMILGGSWSKLSPKLSPPPPVKGIRKGPERRERFASYRSVLAFGTMFTIAPSSPFDGRFRFRV